MEYYSVNDLIRDYEYTASGYFFSKDTMRFFKSRVLSEFKKVADGYLFMTSEQGPVSGSKRVYTVRKARVYADETSFCGKRIEIETVDGVQFTTRARCLGYIKRAV